MNTELDRVKVKEFAISLSHAAKSVIDQLAIKERSPEALEAAKLLDEGLTRAVPDAAEPDHKTLAA